LTSADVVRHKLVGKIVAAYDTYEAAAQRGRTGVAEGR
jgi:phosphate starvation-inducible protein PhoH